MHDIRIMELAIKGLEAERARIDKELSDLRRNFKSEANGPAEGATVMAFTPGTSQKRRMSAAARKKISDAMKRSHAVRKAAAKK
jgi:hypothetical protein